MKGSPSDNKALSLEREKFAVQLICLSAIVMSPKSDVAVTINVSREKERGDANKSDRLQGEANAIEY